MIRSSILRAQISCHYSECFINSKLGLFHFLSCWMKVPDNLTHSLKHSVIHPETKLKEQKVWVRQMVRNASGWWSFPSVPSLDDCGPPLPVQQNGEKMVSARKDWRGPLEEAAAWVLLQLHGSSPACCSIGMSFVARFAVPALLSACSVLCSVHAAPARAGLGMLQLV